MIKEFEYAAGKGGGIKSRKVFVIKENSAVLEGIDLNLLSESDVKYITDSYKDFIPLTDFTQKIALDGFNPDWNKAYRRFKKSNIVG